MTDKKTDLRKKAEEWAVRLPKVPDALSPEETQATLHELRVHQIELEIQNEELRTAQAELLAARARYFDLYDLAPVGYLTISEKGLILEANLTTAQLLEVDRDALAEQPITRFILKEDQDVYYLHLKQLFASLSPQTCELRLLRRDGRFFWAHLVSSVAPGACGAPASRLVVSDISERKKTEAERERLLTAIEQAGDIIVITDPAGTIQYVNPAFERITGYLRAEAVGKNVSLLKSGRQDRAFYQEMWAKISSGQTWASRMVNKRKDGTLYTEEATISPVLNDAGKIVNYVAVKKDVSAQLQLEGQFRQSQKMEAVGRLAGGVAHDFNNILTAIKGYCSLVSKTLAPEDPNRADMGEIMTAANRATALTRQLLAFSRKQILIPQVVDLNTAIGDMANMLRRIIGEDIKLSVKLFSAPCFVKVDPGLFDQVIMNLALNARDAIVKGGEISLETEVLVPAGDFSAEHPDLARGRLVGVKVRDNGCGMSPEVKKRLFEPFYTTKEQYKGTGLGLSMVFGTVKQSGGDIAVESEPGKGSVFKLYFPLVEAGAPEKSAGKPEESLSTGTETVLFVEDEEPLRRLGERVLRAHGYTVLSTADGPAALAAAAGRGRPVDLLLTDLIMPGMNGRELALELARRGLALRTLYMSGYTDDAIVKHGVLEPGIAFIYKPFTVEALALKVREVLDGPAEQGKA